MIVETGYRWRRVRTPLLLIGVTVLGAIALLGPQVLGLRTTVIGLGGDPYQTLWRFSALTDALSRGTLTIPEDPIRNFGPLPWLPLHLLLGEPIGYNLVWILQFPLTALATYGFARAVSVGRGPAALAGILTAFAPYRIAQSLGHFGAMQTFWIPLALTALLWFLRHPTPVRALLVGAIFVGTAWTEHVLFLMTLLAATLILIVHWRRFVEILRTRRGAIATGGMLFTVIAFGIIPFRGEVRSVALADSRFNLGTGQRLRFTPTIPTLLRPSPFHLFRFSAEAYGTARQAVADHTYTLGLIATVLASLGIWSLIKKQRRHEALLLGGLTAGGLLLALAARSSLGATLFNELPVISAVRTVNRFLALASVSIPVLATIGLGQLPRGIALSLGAVLLLEVLPAPFPTQNATVPPAMATLATGPAGPLLEIPAATDYLVSSRAQYFSSTHYRRILASNVFERVENREMREAPLRIPGIGALLSVRPDAFARPTLFGQHPRELLPAALASERIPALIVHERVLGFPTLRSSPQGLTEVTREEFSQIHQILRNAGLTPEEMGEGVTLYRAPRWPETRTAFVVIPERGIDDASSAQGISGRVRIRPHGVFTVRVVGNSAVPVTLAFRIPDRAAPKTELRGSNGAIPGVTTADSITQFSLGTLAPGAHTFRFTIDGTEIFVENLSVTKSSQ